MVVLAVVEQESVEVGSRPAQDCALRAGVVYRHEGSGRIRMVPRPGLPAPRRDRRSLPGSTTSAGDGGKCPFENAAWVGRRMIIGAKLPIQAAAQLSLLAPQFRTYWPSVRRSPLGCTPASGQSAISSRLSTGTQGFA